MWGNSWLLGSNQMQHSFTDVQSLPSLWKVMLSSKFVLQTQQIILPYVTPIKMTPTVWLTQKNHNPSSI